MATVSRDVRRNARSHEAQAKSIQGTAGTRRRLRVEVRARRAERMRAVIMTRRRRASRCRDERVRRRGGTPGDGRRSCARRAPRAQKSPVDVPRAARGARRSRARRSARARARTPREGRQPCSSAPPPSRLSTIFRATETSLHTVDSGSTAPRASSSPRALRCIAGPFGCGAGCDASNARYRARPSARPSARRCCWRWTRCGGDPRRTATRRRTPRRGAGQAQFCEVGRPTSGLEQRFASSSAKRRTRGTTAATRVQLRLAAAADRRRGLQRPASARATPRAQVCTQSLAVNAYGCSTSTSGHSMSSVDAAQVAAARWWPRCFAPSTRTATAPSRWRRAHIAGAGATARAGCECRRCSTAADTNGDGSDVGDFAPLFARSATRQTSTGGFEACRKARRRQPRRARGDLAALAHHANATASVLAPQPRGLALRRRASACR